MDISKKEELNKSKEDEYPENVYAAAEEFVEMMEVLEESRKTVIKMLFPEDEE